MTKLLTRGLSSAKLAKDTDGIDSSLLYLQPDKDLCPAATAGCLAGCLKSAGRMHMSNAVKARLTRTELMRKQPFRFHADLSRELRNQAKRAAKAGLKPVARLNGTSDLDWTRVYKDFPATQFYEYTKRPDLAYRLRKLPNVHPTFSRSEATPDGMVRRMIRSGINVAVVFDTKRGQPLPASYLGIPVIDGDLSDYRYKDPVGVIVGLRAKGKARQDQSGFVVRVAKVWRLAA